MCEPRNHVMQIGAVCATFARFRNCEGFAVDSSHIADVY